VKLVVNLFGGPGCGKSTVAAGLFYELKRNGLSAELVTEFAKDCIWEERHVLLEEDQLFILAEQHRRIYRLRGKVDIIITDSPLVLSALYFNDLNVYSEPYFKAFCLDLFSKYPNLNILLKRNPVFTYDANGRTQAKLEEAQAVDRTLAAMMEGWRIPCSEVVSDDNVVPAIMETIKEKLA